MASRAVPSSKGLRAEAQQEGFADLLDELRAGSQEAARQIVEDYTPQVLRVIRNWLPKKIRSKVDSIDLANTMLGSLLVNHQRLDCIKTADELMAFLCHAAKCRVIEEYRRYTNCAARDVGSEVGSYEECSGQGAAGNGRHGDLRSSPSQIAMVREEWKLLVAKMSPRERHIVMLRSQGLTYQEIADQIDGVSESSAHRIVTAVAKQLSV